MPYISDLELNGRERYCCDHKGYETHDRWYRKLVNGMHLWTCLSKNDISTAASTQEGVRGRFQHRF